MIKNLRYIRIRYRVFELISDAKLQQIGSEFNPFEKKLDPDPREGSGSATLLGGTGDEHICRTHRHQPIR